MEKQDKRCKTCDTVICNPIRNQFFCKIECKPSFRRSKPTVELNCNYCGNVFETNRKRVTCCSKECRRLYNQDVYRIRHSEGKPSIICKVCNMPFRSLMGHLSKKHNITSQEYKKLYPGEIVIADDIKEMFSNNMKGEKNPGYQHGGTMSPWSNKNKYFSAEQIEASKQKAMANIINGTMLEYYTNKGHSMEEAIKLRSDRQRTFTLAKCIVKHGEEEGKKVHRARQEKWAKSYKKSNFSKISQELFWGIIAQAGMKESYFFATNNKGEKSTDSINYETVLTLNDGVIRPDFVCVDKKCIIEFDGDYWHSEARGNQNRDAERDKKATDSGYNVLRIKERDYRKDKKFEIQKCISFLNGNF